MSKFNTEYFTHPFKTNLQQKNLQLCPYVSSTKFPKMRIVYGSGILQKLLVAVDFT